MAKIFFSEIHAHADVSVIICNWPDQRAFAVRFGIYSPCRRRRDVRYFIRSGLYGFVRFRNAANDASYFHGGSFDESKLEAKIVTPHADRCRRDIHTADITRTFTGYTLYKPEADRCRLCSA